jgi:hypothetical protein
MICGIDTLPLPTNAIGDALECTQNQTTSGTFFHGLVADLQSGVDYTFSFFFRNANFDSPYGHFPPEIGIKMIAPPNSSGGGGLQMFDAYPNGWYRQLYLWNAGVTGPHQIGIMHSLDRPAGGGYWLYGFQIETGTGTTPYMPE